VFRRLYRQRNIVVHGGTTAAMALETAPGSDESDVRRIGASLTVVVPQLVSLDVGDVGWERGRSTSATSLPQRQQPAVVKSPSTTRT
jgi:hypothetical protein